jgi:thioredoxin-like negative regulator of GroEL
MGDAINGKAFIRHEFDEAISVHKAIVEAERILAKAHPMSDARTAIGTMLETDEQLLRDLRDLGKGYGATGKAEDVAAAMRDLSEKVSTSAEEAPSEAYEAHAVLLTMLRKQQDSAVAVAKIATATGDRETKAAATEMQRSTKAEADELSKLLAVLAVDIATEGSKSSRGSLNGGSKSAASSRSSAATTSTAAAKSR